jgi:hypothetical protein
MLSLWSSMARISLLEKLNSQLSLESGLCHLGDRVGGVRDPGYTRPKVSCKGMKTTTMLLISLLLL